MLSNTLALLTLLVLALALAACSSAPQAVAVVETGARPSPTPVATVAPTHQSEGEYMDSIADGAVAGLIAALSATAILGLAKSVHHCWRKSQDKTYIRNLIVDGRRRVMDAKDTRHEGMNTVIPADVLRAAQYNNLIKQISIALERWAIYLSHSERKEIYDALDWYNADALHATQNNSGEVEFVEIPEGRWPTREMSIGHAQGKFKKLQSIKWLKMESGK